MNFTFIYLDGNFKKHMKVSVKSRWKKLKFELAYMEK